ncbi:hypothetical protein [Okeania sp. SIO2B3]|uniref:hypothetical protein n=1 Tax=Okeania sp. SIO2B3 TaxID=2607784 RepID=UPI0025E61FE7|nr:hypothetical protein [Okeania sp. SIO2B3]
MDTIATYSVAIVFLIATLLQYIIPDNILDSILGIAKYLIGWKIKIKSNFLIHYYQIDSNLDRQEQLKVALNILFKNMIFIGIYSIATAIFLVFVLINSH